jgi:hypothetical protein
MRKNEDFFLKATECQEELEIWRLPRSPAMFDIIMLNIGRPHHRPTF